MRMRWGVVLGIVTVAALAGCGSGPNSLGVIAYDPTGLAFRHMMEGDKSLNIALGLGGFDSKIAHGHVDYIMHFDRIAQDDWNPYWGIGVGYLTKVDSNDDSIDDNEIGIALRVPLGISYQTDEWDFFAQLAGYVGRRLGISAALGVRFNL